MAGFKDSIAKNFTKMNMKTANFMEKNKAKTYIKTLQDENTSLYFKIGKLLYEKYLEDNISKEVFEEDFYRITRNLQVILEQEERIKNLELEESRVLGTSKTQSYEASRPMQSENQGDVQICSSCGATNEPMYKFCIKCGTSLENKVEESQQVQNVEPVEEQQENISQQIEENTAKICSSCGATNEPMYKFCVNCGSNLEN